MHRVRNRKEAEQFKMLPRECFSSIVEIHLTAAGNFEHHIDLRTFYRYRSDFSRRNVCLEVKTTDSDESRLNKKDDINLRKKGVTALRLFFAFSRRIKIIRRKLFLPLKSSFKALKNSLLWYLIWKATFAGN